MRAIVTLCGGVRVRIDIQRVVRARLHAGFAADASLTVEIHNTVRALVQSAGRTDLYARSILAMLTTLDREKAPSIRELAFFDVLDPGAKRANGHLIF